MESLGFKFSNPFYLTHRPCFLWQFDISDLVRCMRLQRHGMVQTEVSLGWCLLMRIFVKIL